MKRVWQALLISVRVPVVLLVVAACLLCALLCAPSRPMFHFLGDNEPDQYSMRVVGNTETSQYVYYTVPPEPEALSDAMQAELTALGFVRSPGSASPSSYPEFTKSGRKTHVTVRLRRAELVPSRLGIDSVAYADVPGCIRVEINQYRRILTWRQELHYWWGRLTP